MKNIYEPADFFMSRHAMLPRQAAQAANIFEHYKKEKLFQEAVLIASPELAKSLQSLSINEKTRLSLVKYFQRMSFRATPFGLFSAVGWGEFAEKTALEVGSEHVQVRIRPDMKWLQSIVEFCHKEKNIVRRLKVMQNPFHIQDRGRFSLTKMSEETHKRKAHSIKRTAFSHAALQLAEKPIVYRELEELLIKQFEAHDPEKIEQNLWQIFQQEFLLSELSPQLERTVNLAPLLAIAQEIPELSFLQKLEPLLESYQKGAPGEGLPILKEIFDTMLTWKATDYPVQVDSCQTKLTTLPTSIKETLGDVATLLMRLAPTTGFPHIQKYHKNFIEKYGPRRLVPFMELVNEIQGLGLPVAQNSKEASFASSLFSCIDQQELIIDDLVKNLPEPSLETIQKAPLSMELFFEIDAASTEEIDKGEFTLILNPTVASSQAASTFGRFFYLWDSEKAARMRAFLKKEEALLPHATFVEASFMPENARTANVCLQETLRSHQLQFHYHEHSECSLPISDIYVGASQSHLYLYSKKLQKPLIITLSTAINPDLAPPHLKLMLEISKAHFSPFVPYPWNGVENAAHLPRIRYKNVILTPRRWSLQIDEKCEREEAKKTLLEAIAKHTIPSQVFLCHFDNRLFLNLSDKDHFELLLQDLLQKKRILLFESLISEKGHTQEFVLPIVKKSEYALKEMLEAYPPTETIPSEERIFLPGGPWLYLKLYLSQEDEERFIKDELMPLAEHLQAHGHITKWFYVRYVQEKPHIRLRLNAPSQDLLAMLHAWSHEQMRQGTLSHIELSSYERETERYGGPECIDLAEEFFCADSLLCMKLLGLKELPFVAACNILQILDHFFDTFEDKLDFLRPLEQDNHLLAGKRELLKSMDKFCHDLFDPAPLKRYVEKIRQLEGANGLWNTRKGILDSLVHMHCNRLLGIDGSLERQARVAALYFLKRLSRVNICK